MHDFLLNQVLPWVDFSVRGTLNSIYEPAYNIGIAVTFVLGNFFEPVDQAKILLPIPILFVIVAFFMPQTPEYWIRRNNQEVR